ncbi:MULTISPECIES: nitrogen fixation protein NifX [unclassified Frankia]|uniref:nitrogen fixation protein NifX n=1 Tax=unclassified Frankia TaxID=2632575 RepID=UPI002AD592E6|nr:MULTISPECIES: nitrogen fixation protein NifX [unclassified Frankia]
MLKVAFATSDGSAVDQHFGVCRRFDVYEVSATAAERVETRTLPPADDDEDSKIESRLAAVADCSILHVCAIGGSAAARVVKAKVHPVKTEPDTRVIDLIERLQGVLAGNPPPWLRKVMRQHSPGLAPNWTPR